uniref:Uncharacterized protein n=1 Tax=Neobodo designis TaxID=312471 RepID=A0A7S1LVF1_NEODS|mmetsp:Transcript_29150/g.90127  ORF Transcript_29150/g.90127 Transcript_29150/m.90127 type:complete len:484 (+) Transcript_29150:22-1473(+)
MELDDELKLRYLQAQRNAQFLTQSDATDGFVPEDVEQRLHLFRRLHDDEAFDDWLSLGVQTTVESTIADADAKREAAAEARKEAALELEARRAQTPGTDAGSWDDLRSVLLAAKKKPKVLLEENSDTCEIQHEAWSTAERTSSAPMRDFDAVYAAAISTTEQAHTVLDRACQDRGFASVGSLRTAAQQMLDTMVLKASAQPGETAVKCDNHPQSASIAHGTFLLLDETFGSALEMESVDSGDGIVEAGEAISRAMFEHELACDEATVQMNACHAVTEENALMRDGFLARCVDDAEAHRDLGDVLLRLKLARSCHEHFRSCRRSHLQRVNCALHALQSTLEDIHTRVAFPLRHDELESHDAGLFDFVGQIVSALNEVHSLPLSLDGHRDWQRTVLRDGFTILNVCASQYAALSVSEVNVGCSTRKAAERIRDWACLERLTMSEIAFRQLRHDNFRIGISLCVSARFVLGELEREYDTVWGFAYW